MAAEQPYEELEGNLTEYTTQLEQVEQLLLMDPDNDELQDMYNSLAEVIQLTTELLKDAQQDHASRGLEVQASKQYAGAAITAQEMAALASHMVTTPPQLQIPSILPASVAEQIRRAQIRAALLGQAPAAWAIGAKCQAVYSGDYEFYPATVQGVTPGGKFIVIFDGYEGKEELDPQYVRPPPETNEVYKGVAAPKRKAVEDEPIVTEIPKWLEIKDADDEKTKSRKRKLLKSYKSKMRFQTMDLVQKEKANSWQNFVSGKGAKKKTGFFTGRKKESMFKVPEGSSSKVGVVGSGKGMTNYQKRARHEFGLDE